MLEYRPYEWRMGSPKKEKQLIAVGIVSILIVTALLVIGWGKLFGVLYEPDTETHPYHYDPGLPGLVEFWLKGYYYDPVDVNDEELLSQSKYISCWKPGGHSEEITIGGKLWAEEADGKIIWYRYSVYLDDNPTRDANGDWINPDYYSTPEHHSSKIYWKNTPDGNNPGQVYVNDFIEAGTNLIPSYNIEILDPYVGYIRVKLEVRILGWNYGETMTISDEATILDGSGSIIVLPHPETGEKVFEEGETVTFQVSTGYSGRAVGQLDKGWQIRISKPDGTPYKGQGYPLNISDNLNNAKFYFTVPDGAWNPSGDNTWEVTLFNTMVSQGEDEFFTVDTREKAPTMSDIQISDTTPQINQMVTVTLIGEPNQYTNSPIKEFEVDVYYGMPHQVIDYIYEDTRFPATDNQATFTFTPMQAGHITVEAFCVDYEGRQSGEMSKGLDASGEPPPSERYAPGQMWTYTFDENIHYPIFPDYKPEVIMYTFIDSNNEVVYVIKHTPDVSEKTGESGGNQYWHIVDTASFVIPAFAKTGTWTVKIVIADPITKIGPWEFGTYLAQRSTAFTVTKGSLAQNLLAPMYWHKTFLGFEINWKLPCPLVWIIIAIAIISLIIVGILQRQRIIAGFKRIKR